MSKVLISIVMLMYLVLNATISIGRGTVAMAQDLNRLDEFAYDEPERGVRPLPRPWRELLGKRVEAQGVAWGAFEKGAGDYVILNRSVVFIADSEFLKADASGRLVKVNGTLRLRMVKAGRGRSTGPASDVEIFELFDTKWEFIDRLTWPWLREPRKK